MAGKKTTKKRATKKPAARKVVSKVHLPASVDDYFDPETGQLLDPKWELFCQAWIQTFDRKKALEEAAYKPKNDKQVWDLAYQLLRREPIQKRVRAILAERVTDMTVTEDWIVLKMLSVFEKAMEEKPILDNEGNIVGTDYKDLRVALATLEKLGTNVGMFQKKDDHKAQTVIFNMNYGNPDAEEPKKIPRQFLEGTSERLQ